MKSQFSGLPEHCSVTLPSHFSHFLQNRVPFDSLFPLCLDISCKLDSNVLYHCLQTMNDAILKDVRAHHQNPEKHSYPDNEYNALSFELTKYLHLSGQHDPLAQLYISAKPIEDMDLVLFLTVVSRLPTLGWNTQLSSLMPRDLKKGLDSTPLTVGIMTALQQFHVAQTDRFFGYLGQYIRSHMDPGNKYAPLADPVSPMRTEKLITIYCSIPFTFSETINLARYHKRFSLACTSWMI